MTTAPAHTKITRDAGDKESAHNKALRSKDKERDARVALFEPAMASVVIHECRVHTIRAAAPPVFPWASNATEREACACILGMDWTCAARWHFARFSELLGL